MRHFRGQGSGVRGQGQERAEGGGRRAEKSPLSTIHHPLSTNSSALRLPPSAFTLVELLVVIVIISMLVGLLMPALMSARGRARIAQCTNNQHELSTAIHSYDLAKRRLPGYLNQVRGQTVSWIPVLLLYIGRMDLWEGVPASFAAPAPQYDGWRYGTPMTQPTSTMRVYIKQLVCPDDADATGDCPLTYVPNLGLYNSVPTPLDLGLTSPSMFRDYSSGTSGAFSLSSVKSASRTLMLSEKNPSAISLSPPTRQWTDPYGLTSPTLADMQSRLGFSWPDPSIPTFNNILVNTPLPPIHPGIVIVTFCDGHTESLSDDTLCNAYLAVP